MKIKLLVVLLCCTNLIYAQDDMADWVYVTPNEDTLYLQIGEDISMNTYNIWMQDSTWSGVNPVIRFKSKEYINRRKKELWK